jgi:phage tail-like protein
MTLPHIHLNHRFRVEIDGLTAQAFAEIILPEGRADIVEYREGNAALARKLPGHIHFSNLVLRRGLSESRELSGWWQDVAAGQNSRRNITVVLMDLQGQDAKRWVMTDCWPTRYTVAPLIAIDGDAVVTETLECAVEGFESVK